MKEGRYNVFVDRYTTYEMVFFRTPSNMTMTIRRHYLDMSIQHILSLAVL